RPRLTTSSSSPRSASISSVAGCVVDARGDSSTHSAASNTRTSTPRWASPRAATTPTGPAPATMTVFSTFITTCRLLLLDPGGLERAGPGGDIGLDHLAEFFGRIAEWIDAI